MLLLKDSECRIWQVLSLERQSIQEVKHCVFRDRSICPQSSYESTLHRSEYLHSALKCAYASFSLLRFNNEHSPHDDFESAEVTVMCALYTVCAYQCVFMCFQLLRWHSHAILA